MVAARALGSAVIAAFLAGCGGGGGSSPLPTSMSTAPNLAPIAAAPSSGKAATACVAGSRCITILVPQASASTKSVRTQAVRPLYVSPSTASARITVATATGSRADGLLNGTPLSGYPIIATISPTSPGCGVDVAGATTCTVALPNIGNNGVGYGVSVALFDASNNVLGTSVISQTSATIDGSGNPLAYAPLDFGTVSAGTTNLAHATVSGVLAAVHVTQGHGFVENTAGASTVALLPEDAGGNVFTGTTRYVDRNGVVASLSLYPHRTPNIGDLAQTKTKDAYSATYDCPSNDPNGAGSQAALLDPTCTATVAYDGTDVMLPNAVGAQNGTGTFDGGDEFNVLVTAGPSRPSSMGTLFPIIRPRATLLAPTVVSFADNAAPVATISYDDFGFGIRNKSSNNSGYPGFFGADDCGANPFVNPPASQRASVTVTDEGTTTVQAVANGSCIVSSVLYELQQTQYTIGQRESEQIPVFVGAPIPTSSAVQVTPSVVSFADATSAATMRLSQYADPSIGPQTYGTSVAFCLTSDVTFAARAQMASNVAPPTALAVAPSSFTLTGTAHQDLALAQGGSGNVLCQIDVTPDFGPNDAPFNGTANIGAHYYAASSF